MWVYIVIIRSLDNNSITIDEVFTDEKEAEKYVKENTSKYFKYEIIDKFAI